LWRLQDWQKDNLLSLEGTMQNRNYKIGVVGAGSWGTTLAAVARDRGHDVTLWVYEKELLEILNRRHINTYYLPNIELDRGLHFTTRLREALEDKALVFWVTPVRVFREMFKQGMSFFAAKTIHVCASKGIENESLKRISQIAEETCPRLAEKGFVILSGPSFAKETSKKMPTAVVVASRDRKSAETVQAALATDYFRTYTSEDVIGVEFGGALKNVIAVASGIVEGLGFGNNTRAALITRGLAEITRLGVHLGADPRTFAGLSGMGDLVLTCNSSLSRNFTVGKEIGQGRTLDDILEKMNMVAEGVYTTKAADSLAKTNGIEMPIVGEVYAVLFANKNPRQAVKDLMRRDLTKENV